MFTKSTAMWSLNSVDDMTIIGNYYEEETLNLYCASFDDSNFGPLESSVFICMSFDSITSDITIFLNIETTLGIVAAEIVFELEQVA